MLLRELGAKRAAFFFVERDDIARAGQLELLATLARWYTPGDPFSPTPAVLPVWCGSYLPFEAAFDRFAFFDVHVTLVGCATDELRTRLVEHAITHPPVGMFAHDEDANEPDLPLVFKGAVLPNALVYNGEVGRKVDRARAEGDDLLHLPSRAAYRRPFPTWEQALVECCDFAPAEVRDRLGGSASRASGPPTDRSRAGGRGNPA